MNEEAGFANCGLVEVAATLVCAYVENNSVEVATLPQLISSVYAALTALNAPRVSEPLKPIPPVPIKKTVTPDAIISLEDGRPYKSLKRHLKRHGLTPAQY